MFNRDYYINKVKPYIDLDNIKIFVGLRSSGKSFIFHQLMDYLKAEDKADDSNIIYINLEFLDNEKFRDIEKLDNYISKKIEYEDLTYYIFLDEIQYVPRFENLLRSLFQKFSNISLFLSSSNNFLLTKKLPELFAQDVNSFYVTPFSFYETCKFLKVDLWNKNMLLNYLKYGGFADRLPCKKSSEVKKYLYSLLDSIFLRDIVMRLGHNKIDNFNIIFKCLTKFIGTDFYLSDLKAYMLKIGYEISDYDFYTCFDCLSSTLLIQGAQSYNVRAGCICNGVPRYYLGDLGFGFIYGFDLLNNMEAVLKNLVWLELKRRGYDVYTGINGENKIDFVAIRNETIAYFQVFESLQDGNTINIEVDKLNNFEFKGKRYILTLDRENFSRKTVIHKNIIDFIIEGEKDFEALNMPKTWTAVE